MGIPILFVSTLPSYCIIAYMLYAVAATLP